MSSLTDTTNTVVLPHLSLFAGFCHPPTDTRRPDQMRDGTPRKINTNINATSPAEFDALPTYSDTEEDPEDHPPHHTHCAPPNHSASTASHLTPLLPRVTVVDLETSTSDAKHPSHTCDNNTDNNATQYASILTSFPRFRASSADACAREKNVRSTWSDSTWPLRAVLAVALLAVLGVAFAVDLAASQYGIGTGVAATVVLGEGGSVGNGNGNANANMGGSGRGRELHFCLASPTRNTPTTQSWRYIAPFAPGGECTTQVLTLVAAPEEAWKVHSSDEVRVGGLVGEDGSLVGGLEAAMMVLGRGV